MIGCNSLRHGLTVSCLAALLALSCSGQCAADEDPLSELQLQKAKIEALQQQIENQQVSAHSLQEELLQRQQELQARQQELKAQQQQARAEYQAAQQQYQVMQVEAARAAANDRRVAVYSLQYLQAKEAAAAISRVLNPNGSDELNVAVDERANRLIASSTAAKIKEVEDLLQNLDVATAQGKPSQTGKSATEMLQVRIIWLSDLAAANDAANAADLVDEHVLNALKPLGFSAPAVVCQTVTSVVVNDQKPNAFAFTVPVTLNGMVSRFQGNGQINSTDDDRYLLKAQLVVSTGPQGGPQDLGCQLQGAISTPLKNYTVLGTGVVVTMSGDRNPEPKQVPCAFVLQINRAEDLPSEVNDAPTGR